MGRRLKASPQDLRVRLPRQELRNVDVKVSVTKLSPQGYTIEDAWDMLDQGYSEAQVERIRGWRLYRIRRMR